jgi:hypothetical protein
LNIGVSIIDKLSGGTPALTIGKVREEGYVFLNEKSARSRMPSTLRRSMKKIL